MDWKESIELKGLNEVLEFIEFRGPVWGVRIGVQVGGRGSRPMEVGGPVPSDLGVPGGPPILGFSGGMGNSVFFGLLGVLGVSRVLMDSMDSMDSMD
jgi:hypothetical protein